jgi:putative ABC transport system permease protein
MAGRTNVYWLFLVHNKLRLTLSLLGIAFAVFVMFMEVGFFNGLNDSQSLLPAHLQADLVMTNKKKTHLNKFYKFWLANLYQMLAYPEVDQVLPLYDGFAQIKNPKTGLYNAITVLSFPVGGDPLKVKGLDEHLADLRNSKVLLYDRKSRAIYGDVQTGGLVELDEVKYTVGGLVELGPSFSRNGYVFMNSTAWLTHPGAGRSDRPDFGLIWLKPGADAQALARRVRAELPTELELLTPEQMRRREVRFTTWETPVGIIFGIGLVVGFVIGVIICYQVLFNEITDHLPQYATLRAVGYANSYLVGLVQKAALLLSLMGFVPGLVLAWMFYQGIEAHSGIVMFLNWQRVGFVLGLTVLMCVLAGYLAAKKVLEADPAELF